MLNRLVAEDHRPALERQAEEHHRPERASARGSASSDPRGALITAQAEITRKRNPEENSAALLLTMLLQIGS